MNGDSYTVTRDFEKVCIEKQQLEREEKKNHFLFKCLSIETVDVISIFFAEVIGTGMLMLIGCMGGLTWSKEPATFVPGLVFGLVVMFIIQCFGPISGAHLNPAVTVAALLYRSITLPMAIVYFIAEMLGAFLGFGLLMLLTPQNIFRPDGITIEIPTDGYCSTVPHENLTEVQAVFIEFFATSILIFICCASWDPRNSDKQDSIPLKFGFAVAALSISVGPYTGCSMNPARTFAPSFWNDSWTSHWIYWVGPLAAAVLTTLFYQGLFYRDSPPKDQKNK